MCKILQAKKKINDDRKVLLKYRRYINKQMTIKEKNLTKVNSILHFMEKRYKNEDFSDFVHSKVAENKQLNVRLEKYIKLRAVDLDDLMLLKETSMQVNSFLKTLSDKRITIRNKFKFEQNNVLWNYSEWKNLLQDVSFNFNIILSEIIVFSVVLFAYITSLLLFTLPRYKVKDKFHNKPILQNGILTSIDVFQLAYSAFIYPVIVLTIYYVLEFFNIIHAETFYTISVAMEVIALYAFFVYLIDRFTESSISNIVKFMLLIIYTLFGLSMYLFKADFISLFKLSKSTNYVC